VACTATSGPASDQPEPASSEAVELRPTPLAERPVVPDAEQARTCSVEVVETEIRGRRVTYCESRAESDGAWLVIEDREIPLRYHAGFDGWRAPDLFGHFSELAALTNALLVSNPHLEFRRPFDEGR